MCKDFPKKKWRLNSTAQEKQEKKTAFKLLSGPRRLRKAWTNLKRPSSIFSPVRLFVNESTAGILEFSGIVEFRASARLSKFPQSSLSPCPQSGPVSRTNHDHWLELLKLTCQNPSPLHQCLHMKKPYWKWKRKEKLFSSQNTEGKVCQLG